MATVGSLENEAAKRKERLKALRKKKKGEEEGEENEPPNKKLAVTYDEEQSKKPVFKNYTPENEELKEQKVPTAELASIEDHIKDQLEAAKPAPVVEEVDLMNLAPRKPDWDLKRDVAAKLEKLERRTQRAIAELIRERIQSGGDGVDLLSIMNATQKPSQQVDSDDD